MHNCSQLLRVVVAKLFGNKKQPITLANNRLFVLL